MAVSFDLLRHARLVLAVWLLSLGAAIAAPALRPVTLEMVCAGGVMQLVERSDAGAASQTEGGSASQARGLIDCPLCMPAGAPPAALPALVMSAPPSHPVSAAPAADLQVRSDAPAPARGPPSLLDIT